MNLKKIALVEHKLRPKETLKTPYLKKFQIDISKIGQGALVLLNKDLIERKLSPKNMFNEDRGRHRNNLGLINLSLNERGRNRNLN